MLTTSQKRTVWRWFFLCALSAHITLMMVYVVQVLRGNRFLDYYTHPVGAGIVDGMLLVTTTFLLFTTPFFFRRAGALAIAAWVYTLASLVWLCLPVF